MEKYIIEKKNAFTDEFCDEIIEIYNTDDMKKNQNNKQNYYYCELNKDNAKLKNIKFINFEMQNFLKNLSEKEDSIANNIFLFNDYIFLKFEKEKGYISYQNDFKVFNNTFSFFEFIIFLNDIQDEGYVEIMANFKIKPEKGKLLIFPSGWCFPYTHKIPLSNDKYIISGKVLTKF